MRTVRTGSGATAVQIVHGSQRGARDIEHLGSAHDEQAIEALKAVARRRLTGGRASSNWAWTPGRSPRLERVRCKIVSSRMAPLWDALVLTYLFGSVPRVEF